MKIVFLGDSLTWGGYGGSFVSEVARRLPHKEIVNAGVGGNTVVNLLRRLDDVIAQEPDGVFVMVGGNDAISYSQPDTRPYYKKAQALPDGHVTPALFEQTYRELLTQLQLERIQAWVGLPPSEYNSEVVAATRQYNAIANDVARGLNIPVLDLMAHFTPGSIRNHPPLSIKFIDTIGQRERSGWDDFEGEKERQGFTYTFDGLHLTPDAARRMGQIIADFLDM